MAGFALTFFAWAVNGLASRKASMLRLSQGEDLDWI